ncbi:MAG: hypothetical protein LIP12_00820 [Clostridiales bacterium]|nr:hypothetical protein [Clostridiales bacterium]
MSASAADKMIFDLIKSREPLQKPYLSLRKLLEVKELPDGYLSIAADRFSDAELIDGESVIIDFTDFPNLFLTSDGLLDSRHILASYISQKELTELYKMVCSREREVMLFNSMTAMLREMTVKDLLKYSRQAKPEQRRFYLYELRQRLPWTQAAHKVRSAAHLFHTRIKYHGTLSLLKSAAESLQEE